MSSEYIINFNKELIKFLKFINQIEEKEENINIINNLKKDNNLNTYIIDFWNNIENKSKLLCEHNEFLFCKENKLLENLSLYSYYNNENMDEDNKKKLWEYLEFMYLYSYSYKTNINELNSKLNNISTELANKENSDTLQSWLAIVDNIKNNKKRIENTDNIDDDEEENNNNFNMPNFNLPKIDKETFEKFEQYSEQITSGPIGKLAKDIASNINLDDFSNPTELLTSLCSGDLKNNKLMSLINTVGSELQTKLKTNDINQDDLMKDASNIVQNFSSMFGNENPMNNQNDNQNNNQNQNNNENKNNNENNYKSNYNSSQSRKQKTRERLLKKLEEKKIKNNNNNNNI